MEKAQIEELFKAVHDMRSIAEKAKAEDGERFQKWAVESKSSFDKVNDRIDKLETAIQRPVTAVVAEDDEKAAARKSKGVYRAFAKALQHGRAWLTAEEKELIKPDPKSLGPDEIKVFQTQDDTQGGYLAPREYVNEILKAMLLFSPVRQVATVTETSARDVEIPKRTATFAATWAGETATKSETTGLKYGLEKIPTNELYAEVHVTNQMLEDSAFNLEQELNAEFAEQFAIAEGKAFIAGSGVGQPFGITKCSLSASGVVGTTGNTLGAQNSGASGDVTADGIYDAFYLLKSAYHPTSTWMGNNSVIRLVRKLKDGQGRYLWEPAISAGQPATLLGRPIMEAVDMATPSAAAVGLIVGDFRRGYRIVDRTVMVLLRDPYSLAGNGQVRFLARRRTGGQVVLGEAFVAQVLS